jgi:SNF2 family DNA or RNA helicase
VRATLVVCPMSLLSQWKTEVATHTGIPSSAVHSYYGSDRSADRIRDAAVVLTTYKSYITAPVTVPFIDPPPLFFLCVCFVVALVVSIYFRRAR